MDKYQDFIDRELTRRKTKNPAYSLRSFAKSLGITVSHLSAVLSGKKDLSKTTALKFADSLKLSPCERELFVWMVESATAKVDADRDKALEKVRELKSDSAFKLMSDNEVNVLSSWPYATLIELFELNNFKSDAAWIARKIKSTPEQVDVYLSNLESLSILDRSNEQWRIVKKNIASPTVSSHAIRSFLSEGLNQAKDALVNQELSQRDMSSMVMAVDSSRLEEAKNRIKEFRRSFFKEFSAGQERQSVFCLSVQFFSTLDMTVEQ